MRPHVFDVTCEATTRHEVEPTGQDGFHEALQFLGRVLTVGVTESHHRRSPGHRGLQSRPDRGAETPIVAVGDDLGPGVSTNGDGRVG